MRGDIADANQMQGLGKDTLFRVPADEADRPVAETEGFEPSIRFPV